MLLFSGRANEPLGRAVAAALGIAPGRCLIENFPDGEVRVQVEEDVQGRDIYLLQPTCPPVAARLLELLLIADGCRKAGARRLTGIVPYYGYARQDRRSRSGEPLAARLLADLLCTRLDRLVLTDLHNPAIEGFFAVAVEQLSAVPLLAEGLRPGLSAAHILVAPDQGAVKLAQGYADRLGLDIAYVHKERQSGTRVAIRRLIGEVAGRKPVIVDDMISTGGTVASTIEMLLAKGCRPEVILVASHALLVGQAAERLAGLPVRRLITTDSLPQPLSRPFSVEVLSLAPLLAETVTRLHRGAP
ncbi:MAG: ribose-phosphate pyrophosphokinase [Desulfobacteraceae bacterium]|nr:ribose-phosphate pyrophosphokinase [Desulfobacteraceae bacterium]